MSAPAQTKAGATAESVAERGLLGAVPWAGVLAGWALAFGAGAGLGYLFIGLGWWQDGAAWERNMLVWAHGTVSPLLDPIFLWLPFFGTNYTIAPATAFAAGYLWYRGLKTITLHLVVIQLGSWILNPALKFLLMRPRPELFEQRGQHAFPAYPSGHSITVSAVLFTIAWIIHRTGHGTWGYWVVGVIFVLNSYSRVYLSVHWPTDLIGGTVVGVVWLATGLWTFGRFYPARTSQPAGT
ncbi:MAG: phosphatase PAP2 family protein [Longimicrobiales bacterium]